MHHVTYATCCCACAAAATAKAKHVVDTYTTVEGVVKAHIDNSVQKRVDALSAMLGERLSVHVQLATCSGCCVVLWSSPEHVQLAVAAVLWPVYVPPDTSLLPIANQLPITVFKHPICVHSGLYYNAFNALTHTAAVFICC
jgi:hypothetical protein